MSGGSTAAAIVGAGALGAGASIYSGNKAASAQEKAAANATNAQEQMFGITQQNLEPYNQTGQEALGRANSLAGTFNFNPTQAQISQTPGYQFENYQGQKAVNNSAAARGLGDSGAALKGAATYSQGLASSDWQNYYNTALSGYQTNFNSLNSLANTGESAAAGVGNAATTTGASIGSNIIGAGNAAAGSYMNTGNAIASGAQSIPNGLLLNNLINNPANSATANAAANNGIYGVGNSANAFYSPNTYDSAAAANDLPW